MDANIYPYCTSWTEPDANGYIHRYTITYSSPDAKPFIYIDGNRVTDAEFAASYGNFLPAIAYPHADRSAAG